jgi:hypothetical protein
MLRWTVLLGATLTGAALGAQPAPLLDRISATASPSHESTVRGESGAVPPSSLVAVLNLHTGHYAVAQADPAGAFDARLFAPGGSSLLIKVDPQGFQLREVFEEKFILGERGSLLDLEGTVLRVPDPFGTNTSATMTGLSEAGTLPVWIARAGLNKVTFARGDPIIVEGNFTFLGGTASGTAEISITLSLIGLSRADGRGTLDQNKLCSAVMTPTGLPIERSTPRFAGVIAHHNLTLAGTPDGLRADFRLNAETLPPDVADGYYRPLVHFHTRGMNTTDARRIGIASRLDLIGRRNRSMAVLPVIRIGNPAPPRLYWTLMAGTFSQGARGVTAVEERDRFAVASRIAMSSDRYVVPRLDGRSDVPILYDLEPSLLTVAASNKGDPVNAPMIPFRFPSGSLTVSVKRPGGQTTTLGPAPFRQPRLIGVPGPRGLLDANYLGDPFQPATLDPRFRVAFTEDGLHEITVSGTIEDIWGNVWSGGGTYQVDVGRALQIESALLPGTPLEAGNTINASAQLLPGVPADVEVRFRFAPRSNRAAMTERTFTVKASRFGYAGVEPIPVPTPGEYRLDFHAAYRDSRGVLWRGSRTFGGVVAARSSPIILHGARGVDDQPAPRLSWYSRSQIGLSKDTGGHLHFAFHSGDVMWLADNDAITPSLSIDDRSSRLVTPVMLQYCCQNGLTEEAINAGEAPFYSVGPNGVDPHLASTTDNELWAYAYRFVERPGVRIREAIAEEDRSSMYWRFDDAYAKQSGTGIAGDRPNDFKFQFGGIALYGRALPEAVYAIYGSLFVLIANDDPDGTRVFPPFQGNGGGPSGGPLFKLKGRDIDLFLHPTAVRPGTVLELGTNISLAGQIGPTLPSRVEIVVIAPSGTVHLVSGVANKIGYFYEPAADFLADEPGVWRAKVKVWHDGAHSGGQVTPPFPTGDVLGSGEGEFSFYVVDPAARSLALAPMPRFVSPSTAPVDFTVIPPAGLSDVELFHTTAMPGFILEEGKLPSLTYRYDAQKLAADFPNLDADDDVETITFSFLLTGRDSSGTRRSFARQIVLQGDELLFPDAGPARRRTIRR